MTKATVLPVLAACCSLAVALPLSATDPSPAFPGFTGLLGVPTANVLEDGTAAAGVNQHNPLPSQLTRVENYFISLGFAPGLELGGRVVNGGHISGGYIRDLSFNLKYRFLDLPSGLRLAVGGQDVGGKAQFFRSRYLVGTIPLSSVSLTLGYGFGPDLLDGVFGGLEWAPLRFASVLAEYDTQDFNLGLRLNSGRILGQMKASFTTGYSGVREDTEFGIGLSFPLGGKNPLQPAFAAGSSATLPEPAPQPGPSPALIGPAHTGTPALGASAGAERVRAALVVQLGFESVEVGIRAERTMVVVLENRRYNHSFLDGVGVALAAITREAGPGFETIELVLTVYGVPQIAIEVPAGVYREFLADPATAQSRLQSELQARYVNRIENPAEIEWLGAGAPMTATELVLEPVLRTFVATEYGVLDYGLGLRGRATVPLMNGVLFHIGVQVPIARSDDFRDGENFQNSAVKAGLDQFMLQVFHKPAAQWAWLWSGGMFRLGQADLPTLALEQLWTSETGAHQWRTKFMGFRAKAALRKVALAGYTWFDSDRDYAVSLTAGRFYAGDSGFRLDLKRYFGDTICGLFFKAASRYDQAVGFQVSLPLTPRQDSQPSGVQIKGSRRWSYGLSTTVNDAEGRNPLRPLLLFEPNLDLNLQRDFFDAERLSPDYLRTHLPRLREADDLRE